MKKLYRIPDMHCSACVLRLEGIEDDLPGVERVLANYHRQEMAVEFDEKRVSEAQILAAVEKRGYHAEQI